MKTKSLFTVPLSFKCRSLSIMALAGCLLPDTIHAAGPGLCDTTIASLVSWLNQSPSNNLTATVAASRPPAWALQIGATPTGSSEVTYSVVGLKSSSGYFPGGLYAPTSAPLFYDDRVWFPSGSKLGHPFDPGHTDTFGLVISSTGTVYVSPANVVQSFTATCTAAGDVMYGQPVPGSGFNPSLPFYTITFAKSASDVFH